MCEAVSVTYFEMWKGYEKLEIDNLVLASIRITELESIFKVVFLSWWKPAAEIFREDRCLSPK